MKLGIGDINFVNELAKSYGISPHAAFAVIDVEAGSTPYAIVNGKNEPLIRWEGHYFDRLVPAHLRAKARSLNLASPRAGAIKNSLSQSRRWTILERARELDNDAALSSISIGVGQVMIANWKSLGYASPQAMFDEIRTGGLRAQIEAMFRFIRANNLVDELERGDWAAFARVYNGPAYRKNRYDEKLKAAFERRAGRPSPVPKTANMLRLGSKGALVREAQTLLMRAGFALKVDGDYGPSTRDAVRAFQGMEGLKVDGVIGPDTQAALAEFRTTPSEQPGKLTAIKTTEVRKGGGAAVAGVTTTVVASELENVATKLTGTGIEWVDHVVTGIYAISGMIVIGGLIYGAWGYLKRNQTYEGVEAAA